MPLLGNAATELVAPPRGRPCYPLSNVVEPSPVSFSFEGTRHDPASLERYELYDRIATGGMAQVHIGRLRASAGFTRTVAIKRLLPDVASQAGLAVVLADEARLATRIRHPNVVQTLDVVSRDGELFLVMDYVHGESLAQVLRTYDGPDTHPSLAVVSAIFSGTLHGLHAAHEARGEDGKRLEIVHRDVSPQNVLLAADGTARLVDFGIAKAVGRLQQVTREGEIKGKLAYMAPEQISGARVDRRTDVYAAGALLWEMLTGKPRFEGDPASLVLEVLEADPIAPSTVAGAAVAPLDAIALRALSIEPGDRFATALEMAEALERAVVPAPPSAVAAWVRSRVGERLDARLRRIHEIESSAERELPPLPANAFAGVFEAGALIMGRYRLERLIGESEMATVWAGKHGSLHHGVAIKLLKDLGSAQATARFQREAETMARVRSEHVVSVHDAGVTSSGTPFIVMELLQGEDLGALAQRGRLDVADAILYVAQACEGLAAAHALGIVHRDLKPTNLFVTRRGDGSPHVKVIDFGIAKLLQNVEDESGERAADLDLTKTQTLVGSPRYMAPEQVRSARHADVRTDVWALGVILYQLVSGERAFDGASTGEVLGKILFAEPVPLPQLRPDLSPAFVRVVATCLRKDPNERYSDIPTFVAALREAASAPASAPAPPLRPRRGGLVVIAIAAGVLLGGGAIGAREYEKFMHRETINAEAIVAVVKDEPPAAAPATVEAPVVSTAPTTTASTPPVQPSRGARTGPRGGGNHVRPPPSAAPVTGGRPGIATEPY